mmetsp:Transcript_22397/g.76066  ORF Transcript_22397/g.76066 Transcript_22397/m.76066 type:complete len:208 (-) Transcript_22397:904-1527(-)
MEGSSSSSHAPVTASVSQLAAVGSQGLPSPARTSASTRAGPGTRLTPSSRSSTAVTGVMSSERITTYGVVVGEVSSSSTTPAATGTPLASASISTVPCGTCWNSSSCVTPCDVSRYSTLFTNTTTRVTSSPSRPSSASFTRRSVNATLLPEASKTHRSPCLGSHIVPPAVSVHTPPPYMTSWSPSSTPEACACLAGGGAPTWSTSRQ